MVDTMNFSDCLFCQRFHSAGEHVFIAQNYNTNTKSDDDLLCLRSEVKNFPCYVSIYTKEGEFVCSVQLQSSPKLSITGITVTTKGRIAIALYDSGEEHGGVHVF